MREIDQQLPTYVKRLDVIRVEYGKKTMCRCFDPCYEIDFQNKLVYCKDCGAIVDPFEALLSIAGRYDRFAAHTEALLEERRQIDNYKPHLVVNKELERRYRMQKFTMMPSCPVCGENFDLKELLSTHWTHRDYVERKRRQENKDAAD